MKAVLLNSIGDESSGLYVFDENKEVYKLLAIFNPQSDESWEDEVTKADTTKYFVSSSDVDVKKLCLCRCRAKKKD
jgi:hypothetical protein